ncbi:MAG: hypothetical protein ACHP8A_01580 [Terriglobales bacterium]|jgi:hypothetical protein
MDESALRRALASLDDCSSSQHWWLGFWTFLVATGVALEIVFVIWEYIDDLRDCKRSLLYPPVKPNLPLFALGFLGAALVAAGVAGELFVESKIATVETCIRKGNDQLSLLLSREAGDAAQSAKTAHDEADAVKGIADKARADAKDALAKAQAAQRELAHAETDAAKAQSGASSALDTANEAGQIARDTKSEVAVTAEELKRVKAQRMILHPDDVSAALKQFTGTQYVFSGVGLGDDSLALIIQMDDILQKAGWKRQPAHGRFPALNLFDPTKADEAVTVAVVSGVLVSVDSQEELTALQAKPIQELPLYLRAAISLTLNITANLYPPQEKGKQVNVEKGASTVVRIAVGQKP